MEELRNSDEYKKAFERADRICSYQPHLLNGMVTPEGETPAQKLAFEDRIIEHQIEQDSMKNLTKKQLFKKYGSNLNRYNKARSKEKDRD